MSGKTSKVLEHLRTLAAPVVDDQATEPARAGHARMLAEHAQDMRESLEVVAGVLEGSEVVDVMLARGSDARAKAAADRVRQRHALAQLRANEVPITKPVIVVDPRDTGRQNTYPLIRQVAVEFPAPGPTTPVVPGVASGVAVVNPTLPLTNQTQIKFLDIGGASRWDFSAGFVNLSKQMLDFVDMAGAGLIDNALFDLVDQAAEEDVVAAIEAAAGDTRALATLATDLDGAEGVAGAAGHGAAWLVLVNPVDWPTVRRALPAAWGDAPRPLPVVSSGATAGTVTYVGAGAFTLLVAPRVTYKADEPKVFGEGVAVMREFKLVIRNEDAIATVTGVNPPPEEE